MTGTPTLDWRSRHDEASRSYPIRSVIGAGVPRTYTLWSTGPVLDQGSEGACVGHGWTNEATASPVAVDFAAAALGADDHGAPWPTDPQEFAFAMYSWCQRHDQWPGEDYSGTSVLSGATGMKRLGLIPEYRWAFGIADVIDSLCSPAAGPVVLGIEWRDGMYAAPAGELTVSGDVVGGHCILAVGYDPARTWTDGSTAPAVALFNSWGPAWGSQGVAWVRAVDLSNLLSVGGEACVPTQRAYGPTPEPAAPVVDRPATDDYSWVDYPIAALLEAWVRNLIRRWRHRR